MTESKFNGAVGALLGEYQKAINELMEVISEVSPNDLIKIVDEDTKDEDCRSIQSVLSHMLQSGYTYVVEIRKWLGEAVKYREKILLNSADGYKIAFEEMFDFNQKLFNDHPNLKLEEHDQTKKITVRWGPTYDVDQLFEHAIVHILRHRRQIEKFIMML